MVVSVWLLRVVRVTRRLECGNPLPDLPTARLNSYLFSPPDVVKYCILQGGAISGKNEMGGGPSCHRRRTGRATVHVSRARDSGQEAPRGKQAQFYRLLVEFPRWHNIDSRAMLPLNEYPEKPWVGVGGWRRRCKTRLSLHKQNQQPTVFFFSSRFFFGGDRDGGRVNISIVRRGKLELRAKENGIT